MTIIPFIGLLFYYKVSIDPIKFLFFFPISILILLLTTFGVGCWLAALNVKFRDFRYVIPFLIQF